MWTKCDHPELGDCNYHYILDMLPKSVHLMVNDPFNIQNVSAWITECYQQKIHIQMKLDGALVQLHLVIYLSIHVCLDSGKT